MEVVRSYTVYRRPGIVQGTPKWVAPGRKGRGRPKETYLRIMRWEADECWCDLREVAQNRMWWCDFIKALFIPEGSTG